MPDVDIERLHRFLMEHATVRDEAAGKFFVSCIGCGETWQGDTINPTEHEIGCEWVALVAMTRPEQTTPEEARS